MGNKEPDKCVFCGTDLEFWDYEYFSENGNRASNAFDRDMDICKDCIFKLKLLLGLDKK